MDDSPRLRARTARPGDEPRIAALVERCSPRSRYARFLSPVHGLPAGQLARLVDPPPGERAWIVVDPTTCDVVALANLIADGPDASEVALLVADPWQRRRVGTRLLAHAIDHAVRDGCAEIHAWSLPGAHHIRRMLQRHGVVSSDSHGGTALHRLVVGHRSAS